MHVVSAVVVVSLKPLHLVPLSVASRPDHVMNTASCVFDQRQDWLPACTVQFVALGQRDAAEDCPGVNHGEEVIGIVGIEGPEIQDLLAMGVDDVELLALFDGKGHGLAGGDNRHLDFSLVFLSFGVFPKT